GAAPTGGGGERWRQAVASLPRPRPAARLCPPPDRNSANTEPAGGAVGPGAGATRGSPATAGAIPQADAERTVAHVDSRRLHPRAAGLAPGEGRRRRRAARAAARGDGGWTQRLVRGD